MWTKNAPLTWMIQAESKSSKPKSVNSMESDDSSKNTLDSYSEACMKFKAGHQLWSLIKLETLSNPAQCIWDWASCHKFQWFSGSYCCPTFSGRKLFLSEFGQFFSGGEHLLLPGAIRGNSEMPPRLEIDELTATKLGQKHCWTQDFQYFTCARLTITKHTHTNFLHEWSFGWIIVVLHN